MLTPTRPRTAVVLASLLALAGCKLIDQRTFTPAPEAATTTPVRSIETRTPLLTVVPGTRLASYETLLRAAVRDAESRDPSVAFDIVSVVPGTGSFAEQVKAAEADRASAADVAHALMRAGVPSGRINLGARPDPGVHSPDVRVYLR